jgi:hypothetical protein
MSLVAFVQKKLSVVQILTGFLHGKVVNPDDFLTLLIWRERESRIGIAQHNNHTSSFGIGCDNLKLKTGRYF